MLKKIMFFSFLVTFFTIIPIYNNVSYAGSCVEKVTGAYHNGRPWNRSDHVSERRLAYYGSSPSVLLEMSTPPFTKTNGFYRPYDPQSLIDKYGWEQSFWNEWGPVSWIGTIVQDAENYQDAPSSALTYQPYSLSGIGKRFRESTGEMDYYRYRRPMRADVWHEKTINDTSPPNVSVSPSSSGWVNAEYIDVEVNTPDVSCEGFWASKYDWSSSSTQPDSWTSWIYDEYFTRKLYSEGTWYLHVYAKDNGSNEVTKHFGPYRIDRSSPEHKELTVNNYDYFNGDTYWNKSGKPFNVKLKGYDRYSGIQNTYLRLFNSNSSEARVQHSWSSTDTDNYNYFTKDSGIQINNAKRTANSNGTREVEFNVGVTENNKPYSIYHYYYDNVNLGSNNGAYEYSGAKLRIDGDDPVVSFNPPTSYNTSTGVYFLNNNKVSINVSDAESGLEKYRYRISEDDTETWGSWSSYMTNSGTTVELTDGKNRRIQVEATDKVGNVTTITSEHYNIDTLIPEYNSSEIIGAGYVDGDNYWVKTNQPFSISIKGNDTVSKISKSYMRLSGSGQDIRTLHNWQVGGNHNDYFMTSDSFDVISASETFNGASGNSWLREVTWDVKALTSGHRYSLYYHFEDFAGNVRNYTDTGKDIRVDGVAPNVIFYPDANGSWNNTSQSVSVTVEDTLSGLKNWKYRISANAGSTYGAWSPLITNANSLINLRSSGMYVIQVNAEDRVGNSINIYSDTIRIDMEKPTVGINPNGQSNWGKNDINVRLTPSDSGGSGVKLWKYRTSKDNGNTWTNWSTNYTNSNPKDIVFNTSGQHKVQIYIEDNAGNTNTVTSNTYKIDKENPTVVFNPNSQDSWVNSSKQINIAVNDSMSGISKWRYRTSTNNGSTYGAWSSWLTSQSSSVTLNSSGIHVIQIEAHDVAGNSAIITSGVYKVDVDLPSVEISPNGQSNWVNYDINVKLTPSDIGGSGIKHWKYRLSNNNGSTWGSWSSNYTSNLSRNVLLNTTGQHKIQIYIEDVAGNNRTVTSNVYNIDKIKPTINITGVVNGGVYNQNSVKIMFPIYTTSNSNGIYDTGGSGIKNSTLTATLKRVLNGQTTTRSITSGETITGSGEYILTVSVSDNAGNIQTKVITFNIYAPPILTFTPTDMFVYPNKTTIEGTFTAVSDRHDAKLTLWYEIKENGVKHEQIEVGTVSRNSSTGIWNTSNWSPIELGEKTVKNIQDGKQSIEFWLIDEKGSKSAVQTNDLFVDTQSPTSIKLYYLASPNQTVVLNSTVRFAISAMDPLASDNSYQEENKVDVLFKIEHNGNVKTPYPKQTKLNNQPTDYIDIYLGYDAGYKSGDVIKITPIITDRRGNELKNPPTYTITIQ